LRVIRGKARGFHLRSVPGDTTRPITDRVKEALINILGPDLEGASFLDLFAGTGSVGIEALSNGVGYVRFIDNSRAAVETVRINLAHTKLEGNAEVLHRNAFTFLEGKPDHIFDYVYIAPPQYKGLWKQSLTALDAKPGWLVEDAWVIVQIDPKEYETLSLQNLEEIDQRRYGSTLLVFYERSETDAQT
jgi:16S rRNA (guanine(966)-N(2))-methyltransferase RsmD